MKMTDMKMKKMEAENDMMVSYDVPSYPYGLKLSIDKEGLEKLGISDLPEVGKEYMLHAMCEVCSVSSHQNSDGSDSKTMDLQITSLSIPGLSKDDDEEGIY